MSAANVEIAPRGYEAALRGDFEALREMVDPEVKWHGGDPPPPGARTASKRFSSSVCHDTVT